MMSPSYSACSSALHSTSPVPGPYPVCVINYNDYITCSSHQEVALHSLFLCIRMVARPSAQWSLLDATRWHLHSCRSAQSTCFLLRQRFLGVVPLRCVLLLQLLVL